MLSIHFLFTITLMILSWQDLNKGYINSLYLLPIVVSYIIPNLLSLWPQCLLYLIWLWINHVAQEHWVGNGDLDILACGMCLTPLTVWLTWLNLACILQLILHTLKFNQHRRVPFIPSLAISWLILLFWI